MKVLSMLTLVVAVVGPKPATYSLHPIGRVEKAAGIVLDRRFQPGLLGLDSRGQLAPIGGIQRMT